MNRVKKKMNTNGKAHGAKTARVTALLLIMVLVFSFMPRYSGKAAENLLAPTAAGGEPQKREVIYGKLAADGSSDSIFVVNHYDLFEMQSFSDYGDYATVLQLTGENAPQYTAGEVKLSAAAGSYYYQGNLNSQELPWLIDITYELDGEKIPAAEAAGVAGELFIEIAIRQNLAVDPFFFENYALQVSANLNPNKAQVVETNKSATVAISGEDRVLNWIVFPGQETDLFMRLQVRDFELAAMTFAGVGLDFEFDFDLEEMDELSENSAGLAELSDAIGQLADGAEELESAVGQLQDGLVDIEEGSGSLAENASQLSEGAGELHNGSVQLQQGLTEYSGGVSSIKNGMAGFTSGMGQLRSGVAQLATNGSSLSSGSAEILEALQQIVQGMSVDSGLGGLGFAAPTEEELAGLDVLMQGSAEFKEGLNQLATGAAGIGELYVGMKALEDNLEVLEAGAAQFALPDQGPVARTAEQWRAHLEETYGVTVASDAQWEGLLAELSGLSSLAAGYVTAVETLQGTLAMLNNEQQGVPALTSGLEQLLPLDGGLAELSQNYENIHNGLLLLVDTVKGTAAMAEDLPALMSGLSELEEGLSLLASEYAVFDSGLSEYTQGVAQLLPVFDGAGEQAGLIAGARQLLAGLTELDGGASDLIDGLSDYSRGAAQYKVGLDSYLDGVAGLYDGLGEYRTEGFDEFASGFGTYTDGLLEFKEATANLEDEFLKQIEEAISEYTDMSFEPRSFVSEKNKNVAGVQFVLLTEAISIPKDGTASTFEPEVEGDFLSRLRALFVNKEDE